MMILSAAVLATLSSLSSIKGHGYLSQPMSRNFYANKEGKSGNPTNAPGIPLYQTTPQGLNRNNNVCGMDQGYPDNDYDAWLDTQRNPMPWISQAIYNSEDIIQVDYYLTAHHGGHFVLKGCPFGRESTQECFDTFTFEFMEDLLYEMPKDPEYPDRAYLYGSSNFDNSQFSMKMKVPAGLVGEEVLLQWVYWTANSCNPEGYDAYFNDFDTPKHPTHGSAFNSVLPDCQPDKMYPLAPLPNPNLPGPTPERFINCAEVSITGEPTPTPPFPSPTPVAQPVPQPVATPVAPQPVDPNIVGTCGGGNRGNSICLDQTMCCSEWGWCGTASTGHCDGSTPVPPPADEDGGDASCEDDDDALFVWKKKKGKPVKKDCKWIAGKLDGAGKTAKKKLCKKKKETLDGSKSRISEICPASCGLC